MANYFDKFPKILYNTSGELYKDYDLVTNIFFRIKMVRDVLSNYSSYYEHIVREGETPEMIADNVYNDVEAHWIILYANDILDPQYDWPLGYRDFNNYIANKYRTVAATDLNISANTITDQQVIAWTQNKTSANNIHHYEMVIKRTESLSGQETETRFYINKEPLANVANNVPFSTYENLATEQSISVYTVAPGRTVTEVINGESITYYEYENQLNESKRTIKVIKPEYYGQIVKELNDLTKPKSLPFVRRFV